MVGWSNLILDPTLALIRAQLGFGIKVRAECGKNMSGEGQDVPKYCADQELSHPKLKLSLVVTKSLD